MDFSLENVNSLAKIACDDGINIFGGPGFPRQRPPRAKAISLNMRLAYAKHSLLIGRDGKLEPKSRQKLVLPHKTHAFGAQLHFKDPLTRGPCRVSAILAPVPASADASLTWPLGAKIIQMAYAK